MSASLLLGNMDKALGVAAGVGSLFGSSSPSQSSYRQYKYQSLLNAQQQQYARENAETEYNRQRALTVDNYALQKQGIQQAGFNAALLGGTSTPATQSAPSIAAPSAGSAVEGASDVGVAPSVLSLLSSAYASLQQGKSTEKKTPAEVKNIEADTAKKETETAGNQIANQIADETKDVIIDKAFAELDNIFASTAKTQQEKANLEEQADILKQQLKLVTFDAEHVNERFNKDMSKIDAEIKNLKSSSSASDAKAALDRITAHFNDMGIGISNDMLGTAIAVLTSGKGEKAFNTAVQTLKKLFADGGVSDNVADGVVNAIVRSVNGAPSRVLKKVRNFGKPVDDNGNLVTPSN